MDVWALSALLAPWLTVAISHWWRTRATSTPKPSVPIPVLPPAAPVSALGFTFDGAELGEWSRQPLLFSDDPSRPVAVVQFKRFGDELNIIAQDDAWNHETAAGYVASHTHEEVAKKIDELERVVESAPVDAAYFATDTDERCVLNLVAIKEHRIVVVLQLRGRCCNGEQAIRLFMSLCVPLLKQLSEVREELPHALSLALPLCRVVVPVTCWQAISGNDHPQKSIIQSRFGPSSVVIGLRQLSQPVNIFIVYSGATPIVQGLLFFNIEGPRDNLVGDMDGVFCHLMYEEKFHAAIFLVGPELECRHLMRQIHFDDVKSCPSRRLSLFPMYVHRPSGVKYLMTPLNMSTSCFLERHFGPIAFEAAVDASDGPWLRISVAESRDPDISGLKYSQHKRSIIGRCELLKGVSSGVQSVETIFYIQYEMWHIYVRWLTSESQTAHFNKDEYAVDRELYLPTGRGSLRGNR